VGVLRKRRKLREGECLSELFLDWFFTPIRHYADPADIRGLLEGTEFVVEKFVPASGRFDSTSNFLFKARRRRSGR
jgi:hypothetical protein